MRCSLSVVIKKTTPSVLIFVSAMAVYGKDGAVAAALEGPPPGKMANSAFQAASSRNPAVLRNSVTSSGALVTGGNSKKEQPEEDKKIIERVVTAAEHKLVSPQDLHKTLPVPTSAVHAKSPDLGSLDFSKPKDSAPVSLPNTHSQEFKGPTFSTTTLHTNL